MISCRAFNLRGHVQRDEQQLDPVSQRSRASSARVGRCVSAIGFSVLRRRLESRFVFLSRRGHVQRDKQQLDPFPQSTRDCSLRLDCYVAPLGVGFLRRRPHFRCENCARASVLRRLIMHCRAVTMAMADRVWCCELMLLCLLEICVALIHACQ